MPRAVLHKADIPGAFLYVYGYGQVRFLDGDYRGRNST